MGKLDIAACKYMADNKRFADFANGTMYHGKQLVLPEMLESDSERVDNRYRDLKKRLKNGDWLALVAAENQEYVDYSMPFRIMEYDCKEYRRQLQEIKRKRRRAIEEAGGKADEWSLRPRKEDRLKPVHSICLYHGEEKWDGPKSLKDMMDFEGALPGWEEMFHDYGMTIFCVNEMEDFSVFHTELRQFLQVIPCRGNKEKLKALFEQEEYKHLDKETAEVIAVFTNNTRMLEMLQEEEQEEYDMCKAMDELIAEGKAEGMVENLMQNIKTLMRKMKITAEEAMETLDVPVEERGEYFARL